MKASSIATLSSYFICGVGNSPPEERIICKAEVATGEHKFKPLSRQYRGMKIHFSLSLTKGNYTILSPKKLCRMILETSYCR